MNPKTEATLLAKNTKPTSMRLLVYDFLIQQNKALSLGEIEAEFYNADRITIFRTLKTFEDKGIVHSIQENATTKYILCTDDCNELTHKDLHLHLYCKICKKTTCETAVKMPDTSANTFRIDEVRFFAKGICENCLRETLQ